MATKVSDKYRSLCSNLVQLEAHSNHKKSLIMESKFFKSAHSPSYLKSLSGGSNQSTTITQKEYHIYTVTATDTCTDTIMGKGFSFSVPVVNNSTAHATHLHMLNSTQTFLRAYQNDQIANCVNRAVTLVQAHANTKAACPKPDQLQRTFATPANIFHYSTPGGLTCYVGRMHPRCTQNCLTDYRACDQIKEIFPGSIRCMDLFDNETLIKIDQTTGYADYGQESVTHQGFCTEGADTAKAMNKITQISHPFAFKKLKGPLTNVEIENRVLYLQQRALSDAFPDFKLNKTLSTKCHVKMIHTKISNCMAMRLTTVVRCKNAVKLVVSSHYAFQKNTVVHPSEIKDGTLTRTSAREHPQDLFGRPDVDSVEVSRYSNIYYTQVRDLTAATTIDVKKIGKSIIRKGNKVVDAAKDKVSKIKATRKGKSLVKKAKDDAKDQARRLIDEAKYTAQKTRDAARDKKPAREAKRKEKKDADKEKAAGDKAAGRKSRSIFNDNGTSVRNESRSASSSSSSSSSVSSRSASSSSPPAVIKIQCSKCSCVEHECKCESGTLTSGTECNCVEHECECESDTLTSDTECNCVEHECECESTNETASEIEIQRNAVDNTPLPSLTSDEALLAIIDTGPLLHSVHSGEKFESNMRNVIQEIRQTCLLGYANDHNSI
jgi:hypothetical protein